MLFQLISVGKGRPMGIILMYFPNTISEPYVTCGVAIHTIPCYVISCYIRSNIKTLDILDNNKGRAGLVRTEGWFVTPLYLRENSLSCCATKLIWNAIFWRLFPMVRSRFVVPVKEIAWEKVILSHKRNHFHPTYSCPVGRQHVRWV